MPTRAVKNVIHVALLAGGRSQRMGVDKCFLNVKGEFLIDRMLRFAKNCADQNAGQSFLCGSIEGYESLPDRLPALGPLGGLHAVTSLLHQREQKGEEWVFLMPVDMPRLSVAIFECLTEYLESSLEKLQSDHAICFEGFELPCLLRLSPKLMLEVSRILNEESSSNRSLQQLLQLLGVKRLQLDPSLVSCMENVNTPDDWAKVIKTL